MLQVLPDDEIAKGINSLNSKQREVFNVVHTWAKNFVKFDGHDVELVHIFLSGIGGIGDWNWNNWFSNQKSNSLQSKYINL